MIQEDTFPRIPGNWRVGRLLEVADTRTSNVDKHTVDGQSAIRLCNYVDVYYNDVISESIEFMRASASADQIARFRLRVGDTVITKDSETADDIGIPAYVEYEANDLVCGYHLAIVRPYPQLIDAKYLFWVMRSDPILLQWSVRATGVTRVGIKANELARANIPIPPRSAQQTIADYLDRETQRIDELIAEQRGLIETLRERRVAVITTAVVAAEKVDRRNTNSEWYPSIPRAWSLGRVKSAASRVTDGAHISPDTEGGTHDFVSTRDVKAGNINFSGSLKTTAETYEYMVKAGCRPSVNDVLFSKDGTVGETVVVRTDHDFVVASSLVIVTPEPLRLDADYLAYVFASKTAKEQATSMMRGAGLPRLSVANLARIELPLPPLDEQRSVAEYLDDQTSRIDALIADSEDLIALSMERRAALITAAVTGQIDVRTAA
ncbi:restriction endonuclease subunit S [Brevibacterium aurantiacum]|uniref:Uncharacterized protein n=1 Tax=Brevibacterium aurantiacum TaxID=273384 RepID=A0A2A3ZSQ5_BREAU|nr:restriction endonuclease subunit S [Brevibacterium aurantiacum]AZL10110.1 restriction endonuclease subunit S [Brevibacterium aurantiacum]PCC54584.1 hypothetical protein CIK59_06095 [Brevibacterium aurantiacum]